jgi:hypothetical protein
VEQDIERYRKLLRDPHRAVAEAVSGIVPLCAAIMEALDYQRTRPTPRKRQEWARWMALIRRGVEEAILAGQVESYMRLIAQQQSAQQQ